MNTKTSFPICNRKAHEIIAFQRGVGVDVEQFICQAKALSLSLPKHEFVFNLCTDRYQYLLGFCAALLAGQCTLMPPNRLPNTLQQLALDYPDNYSLNDSDSALLKAMSMDVEDEAGFCIPEIPLSQLCAIAFTSGSTGTPTPNLKYWKTLSSSTLGNSALLLPENQSQINLVATVPPQHMWGMETSVLMPLFAKVAVSDRTPFYPQDIAEALAELPAPRALVSSPVHLNVFLKSDVPLTELKYIFSATAPMSQELATQLETQYSTQVVEIFGSSESGIVARRQTSLDDIWLLSDLFKLEVTDEGVKVQAEHLPEEVFIKDVIEMLDDRRFKWLGRHQDMLNMAGKRGSLADLNRRLLSIEGVQDGVMFLPSSESERVAAMVVAPGKQAREILDLLKAEVDSVFLPRPLLIVDGLPRQATGKLANRDILQKFAKSIELQRKDRITPDANDQGV